jgi:hypothetical protein
MNERINFVTRCDCVIVSRIIPDFQAIIPALGGILSGNKLAAARHRARTFSCAGERFEKIFPIFWKRIGNGPFYNQRKKKGGQVQWQALKPDVYPKSVQISSL